MERLINTKMQVLAQTIFEISWEVCNKVGGIYSVVVSKMPFIKEYYKDYYCIGPYIKGKSDEEFQEEDAPLRVRSVIDEFKEQGIVVRYGTWLIHGEPKTFLIDFTGIIAKKNEIKGEFWDNFKIDSLNAGWDFEEPMLFSYAAALLLKRLEDNMLFEPEKTIIHAHEWMTGFSFLKLKLLGSGIKSVFTTHATMLGRSMSGSGQDLYGLLGKFDPEIRARELNVSAKFTAERACAQNSTIFTTVSEITARESEFILGRKPEVLVLNGLNTEDFPSIEETSIKHVTAREILREFQTYSFFPYYRFDLTKNLMFYIACRYEFENKGMDLYIGALGMLNNELKQNDSDKTITAFIFTGVENSGVKAEVLENKNFYTHIKNYVRSKSNEIITHIINDFVTGTEMEEDLLSTEFIQQMKKDFLHFKRTGAPIMCTHKLNILEEQDRIISACRAAGLNNTKEDKVRVILFPSFLNGVDPLLNLDFYDMAAGCHLAVFPSYYEPWGYTPLESAALGVPTITTDLAGFGRFIQQKTKNEGKGIFIIGRDGKTKQESLLELYDVMKKFTLMEHPERVDNKVRAKELSHLADWRVLVKNYIEAHNFAVLKK